MNIIERREELAKVVRNKSVLDVGCVAHDLSIRTSENFLHGLIARHAQSVVGVDILQEGVDQLNREGFDVVCADVLTMDLDRKFELIFAGEIIEHIENPGVFLANLKRHLLPGGRIIVTTPNPRYILEQAQILLLGRIAVFHPQHCLWMCSHTMANLCGRIGLRLDKTYMFNNSKNRLLVLPSKLRALWASNWWFELTATDIPVVTTGDN